MHRFESEPWSAVLRRRPDRREEILFLAQADLGELLRLLALADEIEHRVDGEPRDNAAVARRNGRAHQVVALEGLRGFLGIAVRGERHDIAIEERGHLDLRVAHQQSLEREDSAQVIVAVDHEERIGLPGKLIEASQVAKRDLASDVLADAHHVEVHQGPHAPLRIGKRRLQPGAIVDVLGLEDVLHHVLGQVGREVGDLVGVEVAGGGDDFRRIHVREESVADGIGDLQQDVSILVAADKPPYDESLGKRQALENVGDVRRMQSVEPLLQFRKILFVDERFDESGPSPAVLFVALDELLTEPLLREKPVYGLEMFVRRRGTRVFGGKWHGKSVARPGGSRTF